jgi:hypothetical protein
VTTVGGGGGGAGGGGGGGACGAGGVGGSGAKKLDATDDINDPIIGATNPPMFIFSYNFKKSIPNI